MQPTTGPGPAQVRCNQGQAFDKKGVAGRPGKDRCDAYACGRIGLSTPPWMNDERWRGREQGYELGHGMSHAHAMPQSSGTGLVSRHDKELRPI